MKFLLILPVFFFTSICLGQQTDTLYYKDKNGTKRTTPNKAKTYEIRVSGEGILKESLYNLADHSLIKHEEYKDGLPAGLWVDNTFMGSVRDYRFDLIYSNQRIEDGIYPEDDDPTIKKAKFKGGKEGYIKYLMKNLRYPAYSRRNGIEGKVYLHVKVTKEGDIQFISIFKGVEKHMDQEAARIIVQCPDWIPAEKDGVPIDTYFILPIVFRLG